MINVAVLGYGTIGSGVVEVINRNNAVVSENAGDDTIMLVLHNEADAIKTMENIKEAMEN